MLNQIADDLRYAARALRRSPGFTAVTVVTLALCIGANTAIFSFVDAVLLRPPPFREVDRLVTVWERNPRQGYEQNLAAPANFADWRDNNRVFDSIAAFEALLTPGFNLTGGSEPERVNGARVSANLFDVLGVGPARGRTFAEEEARPGHDRVAVISDSVWRRRFGSNDSVVGSTVQIDGLPYTVVGVMPKGFIFPGGTGVIAGSLVNKPADVWLPLALEAGALAERSNHYVQVVARLRPDVSLARAAAEMDALMAGMERQNPGNFMGTHVRLVPLREQAVAEVRPGLLVLLGAVAMVLLVGCVNVANLGMARAAGRRGELAVRAALGAGRLRIVRLLLTESLLVALLGGAAGTLVALWGLEVLRKLAAGVAASAPGFAAATIDLRVLSFTLAVTVATGVLAGLAPALQAAGAGISAGLGGHGRGSSHDRRIERFHASLVAGEVALSLVLILAAALLARSLGAQLRIRPGFAPERVLTAQVSLSPARYEDDARKREFFAALVERVGQLPGVEAAGATSALPLSGDVANFSFEIVGRPPEPGSWKTVDYQSVTPGYFAAMTVRLRAGRLFTGGDGPDAPPVALVNESFARRHFPGEEPIGRRLLLGTGTEAEIVGVVGDVKLRGLRPELLPLERGSPMEAQLYVPHAQAGFAAGMTVVARTASDPRRLAGAVRAAIRGLDPDQPVARLADMESVVANAVAQPRFRATLLAAFAALALVLAAVGVYGVISYSVARRSRELGVRLALGARGVDLLVLVLRKGMAPSLAGVVLGLAGAAAVARALSGLLYGVSPTDPLTYGAVALVLLAVSLAACLVPARRAARVDPVVALRQD